MIAPLKEIYDGIVNPFTIPDPVIFFIPIFIATIVIEGWILIHDHKNQYHYKEAATSIGMGLVATFLNVFFKAFYFSVFLWLFQFSLIKSLSPTGPTFWNWEWHSTHWNVWILLFLAEDFTFYWWHRLAHEIRFLWTGHVNHHSSQEFNFATALRQGWIEYMLKYSLWG